MLDSKKSYYCTKKNFVKKNEFTLSKKKDIA